MDGWMDGWREGGRDGWMDGWMDGWILSSFYTPRRDLKGKIGLKLVKKKHPS